MPVLEHNALIRKKQKGGGMMKVNIFEGARRISLLIGVLWVVGWSAHAIFSQPYSESEEFEFRLRFEQEQAGMTLDQRKTEAIARAKARMRAELKDKAAKAPQEATPTQTTDSPIISMAPIEAPRGTAVPEDDLPDNLKPEKIDAFEAIQRKALLEQWGVAAMFLFGGLAVGWAVVAAIGWIVRGFMGIPRGQDMRPTL